ncbi:hypothetical protein TrVGV298_000802 [Trichoderma virens]|nr:hypothetical protein TrVGV298_000802 [Trichoderma virens]
MPLFKSSKMDDEDDQDIRPEDRIDNVEGERPPDEYTRLLPNRVNSNRDFLAPDDPAVSPYNLFSIRMLRYLTLFFTALTFLWWVILLVSAFATAPGFHTKGSGFFAFGYTSLTLSNMFFTLLFFGVPSKAVRILGIVIAAILALDTILLASVQKTRTVKWGKEEEEERLTGRPETRKSLSEWLEVLLSTIGYSVMVLAVVLITLSIILRALDARVAPPGKLYWVDDDKYRIHLYCHGNKTDENGKSVTTVLFEGGEWPVEYGLWDFADNAVKNGSISRYCFADRPGLAWSDTAPSPSSAGFVVDALSEALAKAGEGGPWVLASAGIGSLYSRVFSARHSHDVRGLLLIDPPARRSAGPRRSARPRLLAVTGKFIFAKLQESLVLNSFTKRDVDSSRQIQEKDTPLAVISSGIKIKNDDNWASKQKDLTGLTDKLLHWDIVDEAPHEVWRTLEGREKIEKRLKKMV